MTKRIVVLPGDGIGPEVTDAALKVLEALSREGRFSVEIAYGEVGGSAIDTKGHPFPEETRKLVDHDTPVLFGAVGGPQWDDAPVRPEAGLLELRKYMGLFANIRPFEVFPGLEEFSPLKRSGIRGVIIRELTGGLYFGKPRYRKTVAEGEEEAVDTLVYRTSEVERIARIGFIFARERGVPLISIDKANVIETSRLWRDTVTRIAREYPDVPLMHRYVDAAAMELVLRPELYQVAVTENMFGDILSDLAGGIVGSLGLMGSASVRGEKGTAGLFEPIHGSAPDIQGKNLANPVGALLSLASLIGWSWNDPELENRLIAAVRQTLGEGDRTKDLGGTLGTREFAERVILNLTLERRKTQ